MHVFMVLTIWGLVALSDGPLALTLADCETVAVAWRSEIAFLFSASRPMLAYGRFGREDINVFCVVQSRQPRRSPTFGPKWPEVIPRHALRTGKISHHRDLEGHDSVPNGQASGIVKWLSSRRRPERRRVTRQHDAHMYLRIGGITFRIVEGHRGNVIAYDMERKVMVMLEVGDILTSTVYRQAPCKGGEAQG